MSPKLFDVSAGGAPRPSSGLRAAVIAVGLFILFLIGNPIRVIPAGHVGVKNFLGNVSADVLVPGVHVVFPFTRVIHFSVQTQELKETAEVPSQ